MEERQPISETPILTSDEFAEYLSEFVLDAFFLLEFVFSREYTSTNDLKQWMIENEFKANHLLQTFIEQDILIEDDGWRLGDSGLQLLENLNTLVGEDE
jgi:hypothetical protein